MFAEEGVAGQQQRPYEDIEHPQALKRVSDHPPGREVQPPGPTFPQFGEGRDI
jgi:hypothetical protein